jgi:glycosyltransferase involved in cell wall biosynthesis
MNIAIVLLNQGRGSGEVARAHAAHLADRGHKVWFIHPGVGNGVPGAINVDVELHTDTVPVHEYLPSAKGRQKAVSLMSYEEATAYLPAYLKALQPVIPEVDILIGHHANLSSVAVAEAAQAVGKPYALFIHGTGIEPRKEGGFEERVWGRIESAIQKASGILVTTDYVRDSLVRPVVDLPERKFLVLPCGVDLTAFAPGRTGGVGEKYGLPEQFVLCPGALTSVKGPQNVVEATREYDDLATTVFIGDGDLREELEREIGRRGRFLGFVSAEDRTHLVNAATLLAAAPEKMEHFGIIYAEALAGGTVPVAYRGGGVPAVVSPEVGILTERTPRALGTAIRGLLEKPPRRERMARAGRERAERKYDYEKLTTRLEAWLAELTGA